MTSASAVCVVHADPQSPHEEPQGSAGLTTIDLLVNGETHRVRVAPSTPLLYVLRNDLGLNGPQDACTESVCSATCSVLLGREEARSCSLRAADVQGMEITTLEGLPRVWARQRGLAENDTTMHPVQEAWIALQVPQCGYCQNGQIMQAIDLLHRLADPTETEIRTAMDDHVCRCGTYSRISRAVQRAAAAIAEQRAAVPDRRA